MIRQMFLGLSLAVMTGCSALVPHYAQVKALADAGIDTAIEDRKDANDKIASIIGALAGEVKRGAMLRTYNAEEQCAIDTLILGTKPEWCRTDERIDALERLAGVRQAPQPAPLEPVAPQPTVE